MSVYECVKLVSSFGAIVVVGPSILKFVFHHTRRRIMITDTANKRQWMTTGALGLKSRDKKEHAISNFQSYETIDEWIKSLPSRSSKVTLKRVNRVVEQEHDIRVECVGQAHQVLGWEHWLVCVDHEARATSCWASGFLLGTIRFIAAVIMEGSIDEFRRGDDGRLMAWSSMIAKGKTMRNMWFYQRSEASKCLLWFYTVRLAVERCLDLGLTHLDLGPSLKEDVKELKAKYGFWSTIDWDRETAADDSDPRYQCDCSGPYVDMSSLYTTSVCTSQAAAAVVKKCG